MRASVVDLRYRMKDVLRALDRNEEVTVTYRGKVKGVIVPKRGGKRNGCGWKTTHFSACCATTRARSIRSWTS